MKDMAITAPVRVPAPAIDRALSALEGRYADTGAALETVLDQLGQMRAVFDDLAQAFGPVSRGRVETLTEAIFSALRDIEAGFGAFLGDSERLAGSVGILRSEVSELDRTVRTLANLAISARLHGHALVPPRPQVRAFVAALSAMAEAAEQALAEVRQVMVETMSGLAEITLEGEGLRRRLTGAAIPMLRVVADAGSRRLHDQDAIRDVSASLAAGMAQTAVEVSRLAVALQSGDATRQRLERARAIIDPPESDTDADADSLAARAVLAAALIRAARDDCLPELAAASAALERTRDKSLTAIREAQAFSLAPAGDTEIASRGVALGREMDQLAESLSRMEAMTAQLGERLATLFGLGDRLRGIAREVRLSGLNAALVCAKLGREGLPLREIARWLRELTDTSDASISVLQDQLGAARNLGAHVDTRRVEQLLTEVSEAAAKADALIREIAGGQGVMTAAAGRLAQAERVIPERLGHGARLLRAVERDQSELPGLADRLEALAASDPDGARGHVGTTPEQLARLRRLYTMEGERTIHDRLFPPDAAADMPCGPPAGSTGDDLSDILF